MRILVGSFAVIALLAFPVNAENEHAYSTLEHESSIRRHVENEAFGDEFFVPDEGSTTTLIGPASPEFNTRMRVR